LPSIFPEVIQPPFKPKNGYTFVVVVVTFRNLDATAPSAIPEGESLLSGINIYYLKPAPPTAIALQDATLVSGDGTIFPIVGWGVGDTNQFIAGSGLIIGNSRDVNVADLKVASSQAMVTYSFAFEIMEGTIGQELNLQYQEIPLIPFTVR
jgi:hypothetical protein